jgi:RNA polymerase sigma factor (sigma-70 family)
VSSNFSPALLASTLSLQVDIKVEPDISLVQRIQRQDTDALSELYERYSTNVYSVALFITGNTLLAEEATQDAFMKLWNRAEKYQERQGKFRSWLLVMTRHCAIDLLRREFRKSRSHYSLDEVYFERLSDTHAEEEIGWREIQMILNHLPEKQQQVIMLSFYRGLSLKDIAEHLNVPLPTIKTRAQLGLSKLRQMVHKA